MKLKLVVLIMSGLFAFGLANASFANANLIVNGSFEEGDFSEANYSWESLYAGDTRLTGWEIGGVGVDWHNTAQFQPIIFGGKALDLNMTSVADSGILSQTFATTPGAWYSLKFYLAAPRGNDSAAQRTVQVNVAGLERTYSIPLASNSALEWNELSLDFQAFDPDTKLSFSSQSGGYWGPVLDNVVVTPEPSSMLLFGLGGAAMAFKRKLRRKV